VSRKLWAGRTGLGYCQTIGKWRALVGVAACLSFGGWPTVGLTADLSTAETELIQASGFAPGEFGYLVLDPATGETLRSHQPNTVFIPASMIKIGTALAALEVLGPEHRFRTTVMAKPVAGGLHLHLSGGGDPVLVQEDLDALADALVVPVAGRPVVRFTFDDTRLPFVTQIDPSDDGIKPYNPPISALSVNFNRQWLRWSRDETSRAMVVRLLPGLGDALAGLAPKRTDDGRSISSLGQSPMVYLLDPLVPSAGQRRIAVRQPALRTAAMLRAYAARAGLALPEPIVQAVEPAGAEPVAAHESRAMLEIAVDLLKYSNNLSAELIGLASAQKLKPGVRSLASGAAVVRGWLGKTIPDVTRLGWQSANQSGLASQTRVTPAALLALLQFANARRYGPEQMPFSVLLRETEFASQGAGGKLHAKSGTMFYARGQAGQLLTASGRPLLFVLMHTDFASRSGYEGNARRYKAPVQIRANGWLRRARVAERAILEYWAKTL
jgi:serine-type D-Ala-D-Ala carboxypeptidase/endopeptidase (penicillin-binding protein 4)